MTSNTVIPKSREEAEKQLASDPSARYRMDYLQGIQAAREGRSDELPSVKPIPKKKSLWEKTKDKAKEIKESFVDAGHALFDEDPPEVKEMREKYSEELNETLQKQVDKKAKNLITTTAVGLPLVAGGAGLAGGSGVVGLLKTIGAGVAGLGNGIVADALMDDGEKKKAKAETAPTTNTDTNTDVTNEGNSTSNNGDSNTNTNGTTTPKKETEDKTYDNYVAKVAKQQGLGKYVKEDGTVDYDKLQKSKVGYQILNALIAGIGGAAAGAAFKDAPDMSKSMLAQEVGKRDRVVDEAQKTAEQEKNNALDLSTFTAKLGLQGEQAINVQKTIANFMSNLSYDAQVRMMDHMKDMSIQDAYKLGFAQNPYGAMSSLFSMIGGVGHTFSDECCKKFASRKVFK